MRRLQLVVGAVMIAAFLGSGAYMHLALDHLRGMDPTKRMVYRASHINLLLIGVVNVACSGRRVPERRRARQAEMASRWLLMGASAFLAIAFVIEPGYADLYRPFTRVAVYSSFAAALLQILTAASD